MRPLLVAAAIGITYFLWRWRYFGELLPLPFYVKSSCAGAGIFGICDFQTPRPYLRLSIVAFALFISFSQAYIRVGITVFLVCCVSLLSFYIFIRLDQNVADRFFYPAYLGVVTLAALTLSPYRMSLRRLVVCLAIASSLPTINIRAPWRDNLLDQWAHNGYPLAADLKLIHPPGKLGTTEAGILAFVSGWPSVDLWGLNTPRFARKVPTPENIVEERLDLLIAHAGPVGYQSYLRIPSYCGQEPRGKQRSWAAMIENIYIAMCQLTPNEYDIIMFPRHDPNKIPLQADSRFDVAFLRREFHGYEQSRQALLRNGGLGVEEYLQLRKTLGSDRPVKSE
jgi:hypothetical protein